MTRISNLKLGQRIRVTVEGKVASLPNGSSSYAALDLPNGSRATISLNTPGVEVLPDPIKQGDTVKPNFNYKHQQGLRGEVLYVDDTSGSIMVRWANDTVNLWNINNLEIATKEPCNCD